jgi:hypothetical protein
MEIKEEIESIEKELCKRKFIDTGYLDGLLSRKALLLLLSKPRLL